MAFERSDLVVGVNVDGLEKMRQRGILVVDKQFLNSQDTDSDPRQTRKQKLYRFFVGFGIVLGDFDIQVERIVAYLSMEWPCII